MIEEYYNAGKQDGIAFLKEKKDHGKKITWNEFSGQEWVKWTERKHENNWPGYSRDSYEAGWRDAHVRRVRRDTYLVEEYLTGFFGDYLKKLNEEKRNLAFQYLDSFKTFALTRHVPHYQNEVEKDLRWLLIDCFDVFFTCYHFTPLFESRKNTYFQNYVYSWIGVMRKIQEKMA